MKREYLSWFSPRLQREMETLVFGHAGARVLVFPTRDGRFWEYESIGLVRAVEDKIAAGAIQLFCIDSLDHEAFYCFWKEPRARLDRHLAFEAYVLEEVLPAMDAINPGAPTVAHGCSLGAFHAVNIAFRHPNRFDRVVAFSGRYDLTRPVEAFNDLLDGYYDETVYFHTPVHFLPNVTDPGLLADMRRLDVLLAIGDEDPFLSSNEDLAAILARIGTPVSLRIWSGRAHQGSAWRRMAPLYL